MSSLGLPRQGGVPRFPVFQSSGTVLARHCGAERSRGRRRAERFTCSVETGSTTSGYLEERRRRSRRRRIFSTGGTVYSHLLITFASARGVLRVADHLDRVGGAELQRRIDDALTAGCTVLEVDCGRVRHIEHASLVALSAAKAHLESRRGALVITRQSVVFKAAALARGFDSLLRDGESGTRMRAVGDPRPETLRRP